MNHQFDDMYGICSECALGRSISDHELQFTPHSLQRLNKKTAKSLKKLLELRSTLKFLNIMPKLYHILWVMDERTDIYFALEEVIDQSGQPISFLMRNVSARTNGSYLKLGHPSLLKGDRRARIGGEIIYDYNEDNDESQWLLTNSSGRYGLREGQVKAHLEAVASKFNQFGLSFRIDFIPPRKKRAEI